MRQWRAKTAAARSTRRGGRGTRAALLVAALAAVAGAAWGAEAVSPFDRSAALAYSQAAIGRSIGDHLLLDGRGRPVRLAERQGKPLIVNMVYTGCTDTCPLVVDSLYRGVRAAQQALGAESFAVVTIGFEAGRDTPERMRAYSRSRGVDLPNWSFLAADAGTVERLAAELGFIYFPSPKGFDHLAQISVLDAEGRVYRQVYGASFDPPAVVEPLKDLVLGRRADVTSLEGLVNRVRLFCTIYDPAGDRYRFDYSLFIGLAVGALSLGGIGVVLVRGLLRDRRQRRGA